MIYKHEEGRPIRRGISYITGTFPLIIISWADQRCAYIGYSRKSKQWHYGVNWRPYREGVRR